MGFYLQLFIANSYLLSIFLLSKVFLNLKVLEIYLLISQLNLFLILQNHFNHHFLSFLFPLHYFPNFQKLVPATSNPRLMFNLSQTIIFNNLQSFFANLLSSAKKFCKSKFKLTSFTEINPCTIINYGKLLL